MIRRSFLKMLLASPLLGLLKNPEGLKVKDLLEYDLKGAKPDEYSFTADDIRAAMEDIPNFETTGASDEEVLLGRVTLGGGSSITVPSEESWVVTKLGIDGRIGYIYGYRNANGS